MKTPGSLRVTPGDGCDTVEVSLPSVPWMMRWGVGTVVLLRPKWAFMALLPRLFLHQSSSGHLAPLLSDRGRIENAFQYRSLVGGKASLWYLG